MVINAPADGGDEVHDAPVDASVDEPVPPAPVDAAVDEPAPPTPVDDASVDEPVPPAPVDAAVDEPAPPTPVGPRRWRLATAVVLVAAVAIGLGVLVKTQDTPAARPPTGGAPTAGFTTARDVDAGFTVAYPKSWKVLKASDDDVRLVLSAGGLNSLLVRVTRLEKPVTEENLADVKAVTDAIVSGADVQILEQRPTSVHGLPGYYYLYTFKDAESGQEGLHAHYFLFQGRKMNALVFQTLPSDDIRRLEPTFDRVRDSFRSTPDAPR